MYFDNVKNLKELKERYRKLAMENHPDKGGDVETMKRINCEYKLMFEKVKNKWETKDGKQYYNNDTKETPEQFIEVMDSLFKMGGIEISIIGVFLWVGGDTDRWRKSLSALGLRESKTKKMWFLAPTGWRKKSKKRFTKDELVDMYGMKYNRKIETSYLPQ